MFFQIIIWIVIVLFGLGFSVASWFMFMVDKKTKDGCGVFTIRMLGVFFGFVAGNLFGTAINTFPF